MSQWSNLSDIDVHKTNRSGLAKKQCDNQATTRNLRRLHRATMSLHDLSGNIQFALLAFEIESAQEHYTKLAVGKKSISNTNNSPR